MFRTSKEIDRYLAGQPPGARAALIAVRRAIQKALPDAEEVISYKIPAYRVAGRVAIFFAGWKAHVSIYPTTPALVEQFGDELAAYEMSRGTIRFPLGTPVPSGLIRRIAAFRGKETIAMATSSRAAAKKTAVGNPPSARNAKGKRPTATARGRRLKGK